MTTIILIRHGESETNQMGIFAGQINPDLSSRGLEQAKLTAKYVAENYKVDKIYSSDLQRAYNTALQLAKVLNMEVIKDEAVREINAGKWEGMKFNELVSTYVDEYNIWLNDISESICPEGESVKDMAERIIEAFTRLAKENEGKTIAIATHGTPIRAMQSYVRSGAFSEMKNIRWVSNASVSVLEYEEGIWKEITCCDDKHLAELKTVLPDNA